MNKTLKAKFNLLSEEVKSNKEKIYNFFNVQTGIDEVHVSYYYLLKSILGPSTDISSKEDLQSQFEFSKNDFILVSFKSYKGQIPSTSKVKSNNHPLPRGRYNLYQKGRIWSDPELKNGRYFYFFLEKLNEEFGITPIEFISRCVHSKESSVPSVVTVTQNINKATDKNCIYFPNESDLRGLRISALDDVLNIFRHYLTDDFLSCAKDDDEIKKHVLELRKLITEILPALKVTPLFEDVVRIYHSFLEGSVGSVERHFDIGREKLNEMIICISLLYMYNHLPFDLYLFYKATKDVDFEYLMTIMVALKESKRLVNNDRSLFRFVIDESPNVPEYEFLLNKKASEYTESLTTWKYIYDQTLEGYSIFASSIENICRSLCRNHKIKTTQVSSRLKTFESFYNKLFDRANEGDKLGAYTYKDALNEPEKFKDLVFENVRDVCGVRVICTYEDDVWRLRKIFDDMPPDDLKVSNIKVYKQNSIDDSDHIEHPSIYNYRGLHLTVKSGEKRKQLAEFKGINNIQCEIQIRTNFAHGWSETSHPMLYKDKLHLDILDKDFRGKIEKTLESISEALLHHDIEISGLKKERDDFKYPIG